MSRPRCRDIPGAIWGFTTDATPNRLVAALFYPVLVALALLLFAWSVVCSYLPGTLGWYERRDAQRQQAIADDLSAGWLASLRVGEPHPATCQEPDVTHHGDRVRVTGLLDIGVVDEAGVEVLRCPFDFALPADTFPDGVQLVEVRGDVHVSEDGTAQMSKARLRFDN